MAIWLQRRLENYVVPKRLVGNDYGTGPVPRRLGPVFRDRDELPSSADLGGVIRDALHESQYLIVVCSVDAAASRWVNEEIKAFKALGRGHRILGLIVGGEPYASERGHPERECFPHALRHDLQPDGSFAACSSEPIAADLRPGHDDRGAAALRIVAGLIGVRYDELRQRERRRRITQWFSRVAISLVLLASLGGLWLKEQARLAKRDATMHLQQLYSHGREELLNEHPVRAAAYLGAAYAGGMDTPGLRLVLHEAMKSIDPVDGLSRQSPDASRLVTWLPDGRRFATYSDRLVIRDSVGRTIVQSSESYAYDNVSLTVNHDGRRAVVEGFIEFSGTPVSVDLYDTADGKLLMHVPGRFSQASSDGTTSISDTTGRMLRVDLDGKVVEHDLNNGARVRVFTVPAGAASAAYSPDFKRIVIGETSGHVSVLDATDGHTLLRFSTSLRSAMRAQYTPDGSRLLVTDETGRLRIYDARDGRLIDALGGHPQRISRIRFSGNGSRLLTQGRDATRVWDWRNGTLLFETRCDCKEPSEPAISNDGVHLLAPVSSTEFGVWNVDQRNIERVFEPDNKGIGSVQLSPDEKRVLVGIDRGTAVLVDLDKATPTLKAFLHHDAPMLTTDKSETFSGRFSPDGKQAVTTGTDGIARIWDTETGGLRKVLRGHTKQIDHAAFSPDGKQLATASDDLTARLWDLETGAQVAELGGHNRFIRRVVYSPDGSMLLTVAGTEPKLWDTRTGRLVATLKGLSAPTIDGSFSGDGHRVLTTGIDGIPRVFDTADGHLITMLTGHKGVVPFAAFADDGRKVVTAGVDGTLRTWQADDGRQIAERHESELGSDGFRAGAISHNGEQVLVSASSGALFLWEWRGNTKPQAMPGHNASSYWLEFSNDDRFAISASNDGTARLWDLSDKQTLQIFSTPNHASLLWSASLNPAMTQVITAGRGEPATAELWDIGFEQRDRQTLARVLACKSPWEVESDRLVAHERLAANCDATSPVVATTLPTLLP